MNYQNNSKFFHQRANTIGILISFGIVAVGIIFGLLADIIAPATLFTV